MDFCRGFVVVVVIVVPVVVAATLVFVPCGFWCLELLVFVLW